MLPTVAIVVYSCVAGANFDEFDPHRTDAAGYFVRQHPDICQTEPPLVLDGEVSLAQCQSRALLNFMPSWMQGHPDRVWLGARCEEHTGQDIIMGPAGDDGATKQ
jgi:hypothetical protein